MIRWLAWGACLAVWAGCSESRYSAKMEGKTVEQWAEVLKTGNESQRSNALGKLAEISNHDPEAAAVLAEGLKDQAVGNRITTIHLLHGLGPNGKAALPALRAAQADSSKAVADEARKAIAAIEKD